MALLMEKDNEFVANTYKRFPVEIVSGKGSIFTDINGKVHTITRDSDDVIRSCIPGNVTSLTGAPLGVFSLSVD
jgi:hypothetical protein